MFRRYKYAQAITIAVLIGAAFGAIAGVSEATPTTMIRQLDGGIWRYEFDAKEAGGTPLATVAVDFSNRDTFRQYQQLNRQYATALMGPDSQPVEHVEVTVTFSSPLAWSDMQALLQSTRLSVELYTLAAMDTQGNKGSLAVVAGSESTIDVAKAERTITSQGFELKGIMAIRGKVANTPSGLGSLLADTRVYLTDVMANRVRQDLFDQGRIGGPNADVYIHIPSPYWDLQWE